MHIVYYYNLYEPCRTIGKPLKIIKHTPFFGGVNWINDILYTMGGDLTIQSMVGHWWCLCWWSFMLSLGIFPTKFLPLIHLAKLWRLPNLFSSGLAIIGQFVEIHREFQSDRPIHEHQHDQFLHLTRIKKTQGIYTGLLDGFWSISSEGNTRPFGLQKVMLWANGLSSSSGNSGTRSLTWS